MRYDVYILQSMKDGKYYTGISQNVSRRIDKHNSGSAIVTRNRRPLKLVYSHPCENLTMARKKENFIKRQKSRVFIAKLVKGIYKLELPLTAAPRM